MAGLAGFLKPLNDVTMKADAMTQGRRSDYFNHLKAASDSLSALAWIAFTGKDCGELERHLCVWMLTSTVNNDDCDVFFSCKGMSMPIAHVEESWQMAEFYSNKVDMLLFNLFPCFHMFLL